MFEDKSVTDRILIHRGIEAVKKGARGASERPPLAASFRVRERQMPEPNEPPHRAVSPQASLYRSRALTGAHKKIDKFAEIPLRFSPVAHR